MLPICGKQLPELITKRCLLNITVLHFFTISLLTKLVLKPLIQKQHDCNRMGQILFFLYIVQVLDTSAKENADILTPDQSSGLLIASSTDKGKKCCKSELQKRLRVTGWNMKSKFVGKLKDVYTFHYFYSLIWLVRFSKLQKPSLVLEFFLNVAYFYIILAPAPSKFIYYSQ